MKREAVAGRRQWVKIGAGVALAGAALYLGASGAAGVVQGRPAPPALGSPAACAAYSGMPAGWRQGARAGEVHVAAGTVTLGSDGGYADEKTRVHRRVEAFWIDATEVTNAQFAAFVAATGHVTDAERQGGGAVFRQPAQTSEGELDASWWQFVAGADWRHPEGPGSTIDAAANAPVVQVTRADALAYAVWMGRTLPSEAQWEAAAKAGREGATLDRAPLDEQGRPAANFWQGQFPLKDDAEDGYAGRAPVGCFAPNGFGVYDTIGNVWEWTADAYTGPHQAHGHGDAGAGRAAAGPAMAPGAVAVIKGGSFLCAATYCVRYRAAARHPHEADLPAAHVGFRTVRPDEI